MKVNWKFCQKSPYVTPTATPGSGFPLSGPQANHYDRRRRLSASTRCWWWVSAGGGPTSRMCSIRCKWPRAGRPLLV